MNKLFTKIAAFALGSSMAIGVGVAVAGNGDGISPTNAAAGDIAYTLTCVQNSSNTAYASTYDVVIDGITWNAPGNQNFSGTWRIGGQSITNTNRVITGKTAIAKPISKITVNYSGRSNNSVTLNSCSVTVASDDSFANIIETKTITSGYDISSAGSFDVAGTTTSTWAANSYYKITFNITKSSSGNAGLNLTSIVFYEGTGGGGGGGTGNNDFVIALNDKSLFNGTGYQQAKTTSNYDGGACTVDLAWNKINPSTGQLAGNKTTQSNLQATGDYNFSIRNTSAFPRAIKSITIDGIGGGGTATASKTYAQVGASNITNQTTSNSTAGTAGTNKITWTFSGTSTFFALGAINGFTSGTVTAEKIIITLEEEADQPEVSISTTSTSVTRDGTANQTIQFTATATNFSDDDDEIAYEWRSSNASVISVQNVGSESTANLKIVGAGSSEITCYALGLSDDEATSEGVTVTVTNETYSGTLTITTSGDIQIDSSGEIEYSLTGNTHPMNTYSITSSDNSVISVSYNSNTGKFQYSAGHTAGGTATVTITLSSSVYTLETYERSLSVTLVDENAVSSVTTNIETRNVKFGGSNLSFVATVHLVGGGDATGKEVTWTPADSNICTINASADTLTGTVVPVNIGSTTVRVASVDDPTKYHDVTVNVAAPDSKTLNSITINKGEGYKTDYYDDAVSVDLTGLSLTANFVNATYPTYSENVAVANNASGVEWTLDLTNEKVKVSYTIDQTTVRDEFAITVTPAPTIVTFDLTSTGFKGSDIASENGAIVTPFTLIATATATAWRSNAENLRMYSGNAMTLSGDSSVASIDIVYITPASGYSCSTGYTYTAMPSEESLNYDSELGGLEMPEGTTSLVIARTGNRADLTSIVVEYTKVEIIDDTVTDITLSPSSVTLEVGETQTLTSSITPVGAAGGENMEWHTTSSSVATVENGVITAVGAGSCEIYSIADDEGKCESNHVSVTVTAAPIVNFSATSAVEGDAVKLDGADFLIDTNSAYRALGTYGAQFGSGSDSAGTVKFTSTDYAFSKTNLKVVVNATYSGDGGNNTIKAYIGNTQIGETATMTKNTSADYVFEYSGSASDPIPSTDLIRIEINNDKGAIYLKTLKVYSASYKSVVGDFVENSLRMDTYDKGGTEGSTGGNGSCKVWWNDVLSAYNGLTDGQKALFGGEDQYSAARDRLSEWARLNSYSFDSSTGALSQNANVSPLNILIGENNATSIIVVLALMSLTVYGGYFFLRKRKED